MQWERRLHTSPNTLPYEGAAFNHRDKFVSDGCAGGMQTDVFRALGKFPELCQRSSPVNLDKTDIFTHQQPSSLRCRTKHGVKAPPVPPQRGEPVILAD
jgi:hypothetical protein